MKITVYGSGYVGLVMAACLAEVGHQVLCMDIDAEKIAQLEKGIVPFYEPNLDEIVAKAIEYGTLSFTHDPAKAVAHGALQFIAVGTPPDEAGRADLSAVLAVCDTIAMHLESYTIIVNKSTVPIGTADLVRERVQAGLTAREKIIKFDVVSNPEFLKQGDAVKDFRQPDRVVIGAESETAINQMRALFMPFCQKQEDMLIMNCRSAELVKYAANALLATKISFINEMANLAETVGADIEAVREGISLDPRIGPHFIQPGVGYGGSCFGKDIKALMQTAADYHSTTNVIEAVERVNQHQKSHFVAKIMRHFHQDLTGKTFALWGLSFKPNTNDMRDAPSIDIVRALVKAGAKIQAYDPKAMADGKRIFADLNQVCFSPEPHAALEGADALILLTEWAIFKTVSPFDIKKSLRQPLIFDGRNVFEPKILSEVGFDYYGMGRQVVLNANVATNSDQVVPA